MLKWKQTHTDGHYWNERRTDLIQESGEIADKERLTEIEDELTDIELRRIDDYLTELIRNNPLDPYEKKHLTSALQEILCVRMIRGASQKGE